MKPCGVLGKDPECRASKVQRPLRILVSTLHFVRVLSSWELDE